MGGAVVGNSDGMVIAGDSATGSIGTAELISGVTAPVGGLTASGAVIGSCVGLSVSRGT